MAEESASNLTGKRVSTTFRGLLHFPNSIQPSLAKQVVYDGNGTPTALTLGGDSMGMDVTGSIYSTGLITGGGNLSIAENASIGGDVTLTNGGNINDVTILSSGSSVSLRAPRTAEVGKLRIRETDSDYELIFGNPTVSDKNIFSVIVKNDTSGNFYIKNSYSDLDINSPLWINRSSGEVNIKGLKSTNIKTDTINCTGLISGGGNLSIAGNATIGGDVTLTNGGNLNDVSILSSGSSVSMRAPNTIEVGKLRIRETASDYELIFGNPTVTDKNLFSIIVKNDPSNNFYIKNNYTAPDNNSPLWINRSTGEVNIKSLLVNEIKTVPPPGISLPPGQETNYGLSNRNVLPVGMICMFPFLGIPDGWIACDGKEHNKETLPELFSVIGYNYSVVKSGNMFQVPDYRGLFVRGVDYKRDDEPSRTFLDPLSTRPLDGTVQDDAIQNITGTFGADDRTRQSGFSGSFYDTGTGSDTGSEGSDSGYIIGFDASRVVRTNVETRPKNIVALYCIKW